MKAAKLPVEAYCAKRCELYKEFVEFTDSDSLKLLRYCSTRWLSLLSCIERVLNQWAALQAYFNSHEGLETNTKIRDLSKHLNDPLIKAYFKFLSVALKPLSDFNIAFQSEQVQIHKLDKEMTRLIKRMLGCLVPAKAIMDVPLKEVNFGEGHQLADEDLFIGGDTKAFIRTAEFPVPTKNKFFQTVRAFYEAVLRKMFACFPIDSQLLKDLRILDPGSRMEISPDTGRDNMYFVW
ncbi:uncharacterized protein LOC122143633 [Cyprinus carpio]|uniref:Uncharacterized protein LOC122143633 n=1 Tax=Cyprinus carpio TaxID=7962 RepID=A0A9Q9XY30_CYPCA|nr:uncharacterized protein LOC122143633 [Cyprinus carpio]